MTGPRAVVTGAARATSADTDLFVVTVAYRYLPTPLAADPSADALPADVRAALAEWLTEPQLDTATTSTNTPESPR